MSFTTNNSVLYNVNQDSPESAGNGAYDSSKQVYFCFLVTNAAPSSWQGLSDAYALQGTNFYHQLQDVKWFTD